MLCDKPVSALNLLLEIQRDHGTTMIFIAHGLSVVRFFCDFIAVMYLGKVVEFGPAEAIYAPPYHPYTESLLAAVPVPDPSVEQSHIRLEGSVPNPIHPPSGCRFHMRCPRRNLLPDGGRICEEQEPSWIEVGSGHRIYCHIPLEQLRDVEGVVRVVRRDTTTSLLHYGPDAATTGKCTLPRDSTQAHDNFRTRRGSRPVACTC